MDIKDIKELISLMRKNDLSEFRLEQEGFKITLKRGIDFPAGPTAPLLPVGYPVAAVGNGQATAPAPAATAAGESGAPKEKLREITSPMVGTFYASPSPDAGAYVSSGAAVTEDSVVCIIEAMKVMNEIKAEIAGTIVEVVAENGKPVQFGQVLFRVR